MTQLIEERKPVYGFEGLYEVTNNGCVVSTKRHGQYQEVRTRVAFVDKSGYHRISLWKNGRCYTRTIHGVVAEAFIGPRPAGMSVNHIDGNKANNSAGNLEFVTPAENSRHAAKMG